MQKILIVDFHEKSNLQNWIIINDGVMGGLSKGNFYLSDEGHGVFSGFVSLENNGGFSMVRYQFPAKNLQEQTKVILHIKGDGKKYQFRIRADKNTYYSYVCSFSTTGKWETIEIPLENFHPAFRGRKLDIPNFSANKIEEIAFLIGNKKAENFTLEIDKIEIQ